MKMAVIKGDQRRVLKVQPVCLANDWVQEVKKAQEPTMTMTFFLVLGWKDLPRPQKGRCSPEKV